MNGNRYFYDILNEFSVSESNGKTLFTAPEVENGHGYEPLGFDRINTSAADIMGWYGFRFSVETETEFTEISVGAKLVGGEYSYSAELYGAGKHEFDVRLCDFDCELAKQCVWREFLSLSFAGNAKIVSLHLVRGRKIFAECDVRGRSEKVGGKVTYNVKVTNCSEKTEVVAASQIIEGWESLIFDISPKKAVIEPFEYAEFVLMSEIHDYMPVGGHEKSTVCFVPSGDGASEVSLEFYSMNRPSHPLIYHTSDEWKEVGEKIEKYDKFKPEYERIKRTADEWNVPEPVPFGERDYCYNTKVEEPIVFCAYMYSLTGEKKYAEKVARFLRYFNDPETGYPARKKGCSQSYVQEGHFIAHIAMAYDIICDAGILLEEEIRASENSFRIYMDIFDLGLASGHISNWVLSELTGAIYCAVAVNDYERINRFVFGPTGVVEQIRYGAFNDGWWYECSTSYNTWVSSIALHTGHLMRRYGVDLINAWFPIPFNKEVRASHPNRKVRVMHAMENQKWGGIRKGYIYIKDLFDAPLRFLDYRGVIFGMNDSAEKKITGQHLGSTYDLAYTYYKDPAYLAVIKNDSAPDPIFGIGELPETDEGTEPYRECASSDNIGLAMLRSRVHGRKAKDEIEAVLRYGSHGYAHGHFDRTELLAVMRYGRSFFNPEHIWWGYGHFMYKFYVQSSASKNMVTVDGKMQIPADSKKTLFYVGEKYSATVVETTAEWAYPPFGGMIYDTGRDLAQQCEYNASDLDSVTAAPHGEITERTEPIRQVRVMAVTDGYIVLFDYLKGECEHDYDCLYQIKGFDSISDNAHFKEHRGRKTLDVKSDAQFITNVDVYEVSGESKASFTTVFGKGADLRGTRIENCEDGELKMDVYVAYPPKNVQTLGFAAENMGIRIPYNLAVYENGNEVYRHHANAWILGTKKFEVSLSGKSRLDIEIEDLPLYNEQMYPCRSPQGLFLADAFIECENGERIRLADMKFECENIDKGYGIGLDYEGGYVLITGERYDDAIPISTTDHEKHGKISFDLSLVESTPVKLCATVGASAFPGDKKQRRITYGISDRTEVGRFVTVIEAHEGENVIEKVRGKNADTVEVILKSGRRDIISVEGIEGNAPFVNFETF